LLAWSYQDPTASIDQGYALFDLITRSTPDAQMYIYNRAGHLSYREHPAEFNEMLRSFIGDNSDRSPLPPNSRIEPCGFVV